MNIADVIGICEVPSHMSSYFTPNDDMPASNDEPISNEEPLSNNGIPAKKPIPIFHRKNSTSSEKSPIFGHFDVWALICDIYLANAFLDRPILADSLIKPLADWIALPRTPLPSCVPRNCCSVRGARTAQVRQCGYTGTYERRGLPALLHVDRYSRYFLMRYPGYQAHYRFLDPALWRYEFPKTTSALFSWEGLCLCALHEATTLLPDAVFVKLTFPSCDNHKRSSSNIILETLRKSGAARLVDLDLRFDWEYWHAINKRKVLLVAQSLRRMIGVNLTFLVHGPLLQVLRIGAEEDYYTWNPWDIYSVLRECPLLEDLELLSVLGPGSPKWTIKPSYQLSWSALFGSASVTRVRTWRSCGVF